jgi:hypothetical protein
MFIHSRENVAVPSILAFSDDQQKNILTSPDFLRFAIVRNPYTRLVSAWKSKIVLCEPGFDTDYSRIAGSLPAVQERHLLPFAEFLSYVKKSNPDEFNPHWRLQSDHLFYGTMNFSFIGKVEKLDEAIARFQAHVGNEASVVLGKSNPSAFKGEVALTEEQQQTIYEIYRPDFENFGYEKADVPRAKHSNSAQTLVDPTDLYSEIIERNMIISLLVRERSELISQLKWTPSGFVKGIGRKMRRLRRSLVG